MRIVISWLFFLSVYLSFGYTPVQTSNSQQLITYKVQPKDTWTNLSKKFSTTIKELQSINTGISDLKIGQTIKVPNTHSGKGNAGGNTMPEKQVTEGVGKGTNPVYYTVKKGETLYRVAVNNNVSVDDLKKWNALSSNNIEVSQRIIIGYGTSAKPEKIITEKPILQEPVVKEPIEIKKTDTSIVKEPVIKRENNATMDTSITPVKEIATASGANKINETGVVSWITDGDLNQNKFYGLHRTVPIGTIIKVTNRMNNNSVFVKVVGALPTTSDNENVILKITQAAAQRIGALDQRFQAELSYAIGQ